MTRVQISEHVWVNISRRNLCDNCVADVCLKRTDENIDHCELFRSPFIAFKKCNRCGQIYELFSNFKALDYDLCHICNERMDEVPMIQMASRSAHIADRLRQRKTR